MQSFILPALNDGRYGDLLKWETEPIIFRMKWTHKARTSWKHGDCAVFIAWDRMKGRSEPKTDSELVLSKQRMRAALRTIKGKIEELKCDKVGYKLYRIKGFLPTNTKKEEQSMDFGANRPYFPKKEPGTINVSRKTKIVASMYQADEDQDDSDPDYKPSKRSLKTKSYKKRSQKRRYSKKTTKALEIETEEVKKETKPDESLYLTPPPSCKEQSVLEEKEDDCSTTKICNTGSSHERHEITKEVKKELIEEAIEKIIADPVKPTVCSSHDNLPASDIPPPSDIPPLVQVSDVAPLENKEDSPPPLKKRKTTTRSEKQMQSLLAEAQIICKDIKIKRTTTVQHIKYEENKPTETTFTPTMPTLPPPPLNVTKKQENSISSSGIKTEEKVPRCLVAHKFSMAPSDSMSSKSSKSETVKILKKRKTKEKVPRCLVGHDYTMTPSDSMSSKSETCPKILKKKKTKARQKKEHIRTTSNKKVQFPVTNFSIPPVTNFSIPPVTNFSIPPVTNFSIPPVTNFSIPPVTNFSIPPVNNFSIPPVNNFSIPPVNNYSNLYSDRNSLNQSELSPQAFLISPAFLYPQVFVPVPEIEEINHLRSIGFGEFCSDPEEWRSNNLLDDNDIALGRTNFGCLGFNNPNCQCCKCKSLCKELFEMIENWAREWS
ncbi:hypothetical protein JTE90_027512 [Oedothorax gibbosus]|uniref:IRF tryptophan pentad repeat domain-containing protein n=1 Tax=Oedothorax gibbosus TaxID=931172 RepID=A0AAV6VKV2_9ARAC|nr:hypothetical protein JTE90_027512 [Oedothorax gibbosus]